MSYLGLIISIKDIYIDLKKIEAIQNWKTPIYVRDFQILIGFVNFYHHFIKAFSNIVCLMITIVKKNIMF